MNPVSTTIPTNKTYTRSSSSNQAYWNNGRQSSYGYAPPTQALTQTATPDFTPDQLQVMLQSIPPHMRPMAAQMLQNPAARAQIFQQMAQLQALAQSNQPPANALSTAIETKKDAEPLNPGHMLTTALAALAIGVPTSLGLEYLYKPNDPQRMTVLAKGLKWVEDHIPGLQSLNQKWETQLKNLDASGKQNTLGRFIGQYSPENSFQNYVQSYIGSKGLYVAETKALPTALKQRLLSATNESQLEQIIQHSKGISKTSKNTLETVLQYAKQFQEKHSATLKTEHDIAKALMQRQVGPIGRLFGQLGNESKDLLEINLMNVFTGGKASPNVISKPAPQNAVMRLLTPVLEIPLRPFKLLWNNALMNKIIKPYSGKILGSLIILGTSIAAFRKAPAESKVSRFFEEFIPNVLFFFIIQHMTPLIRKTGLLNAKAPMLRMLAGTLNNPIASFFLILVLQTPLTYIIKKFTHLFFGNPDIIEKRLKLRSEIHQQPLGTPNGIFSAYGNIHAKTPIKPAVTPKPENTDIGLTAEQIAHPFQQKPAPETQFRPITPAEILINQ